MDLRNCQRRPNLTEMIFLRFSIALGLNLQFLLVGGRGFRGFLGGGVGIFVTFLGMAVFSFLFPF